MTTALCSRIVLSAHKPLQKRAWRRMRRSKMGLIAKTAAHPPLIVQLARRMCGFNVWGCCAMFLSPISAIALFYQFFSPGYAITRCVGFVGWCVAVNPLEASVFKEIVWFYGVFDPGSFLGEA